MRIQLRHGLATARRESGSRCVQQVCPGPVPAMAIEAALPFILRQEGGWVINRDDPRGATNHGVTQRTCGAYGFLRLTEARGIP
jgi:hypothetical protein